MEFLEWINKNAWWISTISTVIYMIFTLWLILETRKTRLMQEKPHLEVFVEPSKKWGQQLEIVIKNIWYSWAYNISLDTDCEDFDLLDSNSNFTLKKLWFFKNWISFLPVNWEKRSIFTTLVKNYDEKINWKININSVYYDKYWKKIKSSFLIDLSEFENSFVIWEDPIYKIEKNIEKLTEIIWKIWRWSYKPRIITQTKKQYQCELRDLHRDLKNKNRT